MIGFVDGTCAHIIDMSRGGIHAYSSFDQVPIQVFFVGLVVLDPLVVVLAGLVRPAAVWLAAAVMALDLTANWVGNWPWPSHYASLWLITLFGLFVLATAPAMLRVIRSRTAVDPRSPESPA
jgi:hypothetical protein